MSNSKENKSNLIEIRDILKNEMDKFKTINTEIIDNQHDFGKIGDNYTKYSSEIDKSREHINKLKRREFYENLFVYIGFYFFFVCVAIVLLRRFPLHKIIFGIVRLTRYITTKTYSIINRTRNTTVILESHGSQIHSTDM